MPVHDHPEQVLLNLQKTLYTSTNRTRQWLHCTRRDWIIDAIGRHRPPDSRCSLEIGPGSGVYLPTLAQSFDQVVAADVEPEFLAASRVLASSYPNISVVEDDIVTSKLPNATYDLVLCTEVIEHIENSRAALASMHRILKPCGVLILSTPQRYSLLELTSKIAFLPGIIGLVRRIYNEPIIETGHINLLTAHSVREQLQQVNFNVVETFVSGLYLPLIAEFLGTVGLNIEQYCEHFLKRLGMTGMLWTQYYVARASRD